MRCQGRLWKGDRRTDGKTPRCHRWRFDSTRSFGPTGSFSGSYRLSLTEHLEQPVHLILGLCGIGYRLRDFVPEDGPIPGPESVHRNLYRNDGHLEPSRNLRIGSAGVVAPQMRLQFVKEFLPTSGRELATKMVHCLVDQGRSP